jgi:hypothetical protein
MRHPFEGLLPGDDVNVRPAEIAISTNDSLETRETRHRSRRRFLRVAGGAAAGLFALFGGRAALARDDDDDRDDDRGRSYGGRPTTQALGEEGGGYGRGWYNYRRGWNNWYRGPWYGGRNRYTTYALGEEGAVYGYPYPRNYYQANPYWRRGWY